MGSGQSNDASKKQTIQQIQTINRIYQRKQLIGKGTYGKVYRCINKLNGQEYALKVVDITAKNKEEAIKQINNLKSEIGLLKKINHKNIVKYYSFDISEDNKQVQIVLEYAKKGSLKEFVDQKGGLNEKETIQKTKQILCALKYLHHQNIVHRDLKCSNILVMDDNTLKITDFGTAKSIKNSNNQDIANNCLSIEGTPYYMAPEVLKRTGHNMSADIWSLGCLIIEMFTAKVPWTALTTNFQQIINYIICGIHPPFPKSISNEFHCFLQSCFDNIPNQRLTAQQLQKHRWIDNSNSLNRLQTKQNRKINVEQIIKNDQFQTMEIEDKKNKRILKEQKYKQINTYVNDRNKANEQKAVKGIQKSAKSKRNNKSIGNYYDDNNHFIEEIQITPYIQSQNKVQKYHNEKEIKNNEYDKRNAKTTPHIKLSQNNIGEKFLITQDLEQSLVEIKLPPKIQKDDGRMKTQTNSDKDYGVINTVISRQQRNRYLQQQKIIRQQRQQQKLRWQQELKQGANYLREEINNRYII